MNGFIFSNVKNLSNKLGAIQNKSHLFLLSRRSNLSKVTKKLKERQKIAMSFAFPLCLKSLRQKIKVFSIQ